MIVRLNYIYPEIPTATLDNNTAVNEREFTLVILASFEVETSVCVAGSLSYVR